MENESPTAGGRLLRWRLALQSFTFKVIHRAGKTNGPADHLSRYPINSTEPYGEGPTILARAESNTTPKQPAAEPDHTDPTFILNALRPAELIDETATEATKLATILREGNGSYFPPIDAAAYTTAEWIQQQQDDPECTRLADMLNHPEDPSTSRQRARFKLVKGLLCKIVNPPQLSGVVKAPDSARNRNPIQIVVPHSLKNFVLNRYHTLPVSGHMGRNKVEDSIKRQFYWSNMFKDIRRHINACTTCQRRKTPRPKNVGPGAIIAKAVRPWHTLSIDIVTAQEEDANGYKYILSIMDIFTRYVITVPLQTKQATKVGEALFREVFTRYGRPVRIQSDEGSEFVNRGLRSMYLRWGIQEVSTGGWQPQATMVERYHKFLNHTMSHLSSTFGVGWGQYLHCASWTYNSSTCASTGYSPYELMFGTDPTLLQDLDIVSGIHDAASDETKEPDKHAYFTKTAGRMTEMYKHVIKQQRRMAERNQAKRGDGRKNTLPEYEPQDLVLL